MLSERLKNETHEAHISVEKLIVPRIKNVNSNKSYSNLLGIFYGYFKPVEEKIEKFIDETVVADIDKRRKAESILEDIHFVGGPEATTFCDNLPSIKNPTEALGAMYVLEGSTLGGQFISKMIADRLHFANTDGLRFFNGYGTSSAAQWEDFKTVLNNYTTSNDKEKEVIEAANQTFARFKEWIERN